MIPGTPDGGQTKIGILGKITEARVMVCLFNPSENMNWYV